jgi:acetyl esterase/lipase
VDARTPVNPPGPGRRGVLAAAGALVLAACTPGGQPAARRTTTSSAGAVPYGPHPDQHGVLGRPAGRARGLVVLLHGGFWFPEYGADLMEPVAADLRTRGYATWNLEYRRVGNGGGYPTTFEDVAAGIDHVQQLGLDVPVSVLGHSAGGHLAVWAASRSARTPGGAPSVLAAATYSLSGVLDLRAAAAEDLGQGAVDALMGGAPGSRSDDFVLADPLELVPAHGSVTAVHAREDQNVPASQSSRYVEADLAAGGAAGLVTVPGDHFALIDPTSAAWAKIAALLG